jgi:DNA-binding SARP family transcriptional activator/tetratricopeptide (TPR) repeat protein
VSQPRRVHVFGGLRIESGDRHLTVSAAGARALLGYLLLNPGTRGREALAEVLWPEASPASGRRALSDALYQLRTALGPGWVDADRQTVRLVSDPGRWVDLSSFEALVALGDPASLRAAVELYAGPVLPEQFDDWITARRVACEAQYRHALRVLAHGAVDIGALHEATQYYHWLVASDPLDELAHQGLMRTYLASGHPAAALQHFTQLSTRLRIELEIEPAPETVALAEAARGRGVHLPADSPPPLVGRRSVRRALLAELAATAAGRGGLVLVEGDPGIGKSRLLRELQRDAEWRGARVLSGVARERGAESPYAPLDLAFSEALRPRDLHRLREHLEGPLLDRLSGLLPQGSSSESPYAEIQGPSLGRALEAMLRLLTASVPWVILLDDVHEAGPGLWEALEALERLRDCPVLIVLSYRPAEMRADPTGWAALERLDAELGPLRVELEGLTAEECGELARSRGAAGHAARPDQLRQITGGNPLFLLETLAVADGAEDGSGTFEALVDRRLRMLSPEARHAVEAAAVLGPRIEYGTWLSVVGTAAAEALAELVKQRFVDELADGYAFQHELTRSRIYDAIPGPRRAALHGRAADALRRDHAPPAALAWHLERAGRAEEAAGEHRWAAEHAMRHAAHAAALEHVEAGLGLLSDKDDPARLGLVSLRHRLLRVLMRVDEWRVALDEAASLAERLHDDGTLLEALEGRLSLLALHGDVSGLRSVGDEALRLSRTLLRPASEARLMTVLGWHLSESAGDNREALRMLRRGMRLAREVNDAATELAGTVNLAMALHAMGRCRAALGAIARAMTMVQARPEMRAARGQALSELGSVSRELARWEEARAALHAALEVYEQLDDPWGHGSVLFDASLVAAAMGLPDEAVVMARRLLALSTSVGLEAGSDYGAWHRAAMARALLAAGQRDEAEAALAGIDPERIQAERPRIAVLTVMGQLHLAREAPGAALGPLGTAVELWRDNPGPQDVACVLWHAVAAARTGDRGQARQSLDLAAGALDATDVARYDALRHLAAYETTGDPRVLDRVEAAIDRQARRFTDPVLRSAFLERVPVHRQLAGHRAALAGRRGSSVRLARAGAPLGRRLRMDEVIEIQWDAGPAARTGRPLGPLERRDAIRRLLDQAVGAGAAPTDDDIAAALGVSRRTVLRDMRDLRAAGAALPTRRRQRQAASG